MVHAYFGANFERRNVALSVYIRDIQQENNDKLRQDTENREVNKEGKQFYINERPVMKLPVIITEDTTFQCVAIFHILKWKKLMSTKVNFSVYIIYIKITSSYLYTFFYGLSRRDFS